MDNDYWTYAQSKNGEYPEHTSRGGKWLIFVSAYNLPTVWRKVKTAVEEGRLGGMAKAATKKLNSHSQNSDYKVICVYTYDWTDHQDVKRIREELRKVGIIRKISYKSDEDTERGIYRANSSEKISKYYE
ncbi:hypothetical protein A3A38_02455 [Candidatus Kaiserbacteria bacterium RIFCSPLOWO2_01_FULL_53_17]|uniref:DUF1917 domain-containing protein n=1 Tax=Candidatus Kaiserbacteria bacterium RIFCSPLOWO2_01_FULL_53_17 TaxID=1798511 RepID=A0A1F6EHV4_9BACT|nr:MAG: hypothetical protein A3A38_02455 [Candidatus Kaiserbacteria bacterium RIFCSPLOWO2_01_FULL_53_17]